MPQNQIMGWREAKNRQVFKKIALFFESTAILLIITGIVLSIMELI